GKIKISVIVPTYNRLALLERQVDQLVNQTLDVKEYEVIIVNDGSSDGTQEFLDACMKSHPNVQVIHQINGGPAKARNTAVKAANGSIIAFTDDDCEVARDWLQVILREMSDEVVGLQGMTYTDNKKVTPLTHQIDNRKGHHSIPTCNAAYRRDRLIQIDGFDESFPYPHNEDTDVGWRMQELGIVKFCADMKVYHPPRTDQFSKVAKRMNILDSEFTLYEKNPQLYKKYRSTNPLKHIYSNVFVNVMLYYTYSRFKYWKRPKLMIQGLAITLIWWLDLIKKYPRYRSIYQSMRQL
ncbi:MAG: glycosyltransferase, partial [Bacteroidota bacterium]